MRPDYRAFDANHPNGTIDRHDTEGGAEDAPTLAEVLADEREDD